MNMADLISKRRKAKGMTQKQLAAKLGVTDKAVSKWERGNGYPDITYLEPLAAALDLTVSELLKGNTREPGQKADEEEDSGEAIVKSTLDYASSVYETRNRHMPRIIMFSFLVLGLAGIIATSIIDFAINSGFTWSLLPISAIVFSWLCILPLCVSRRHGVDLALLFTSVSTLPFLYVVNRLVGGNWFQPVAIPMTVTGVVVLWVIRAIFATKLTVWSKLAVSALVAAIANIAIAFQLGRILHDGGFDVWNLMSVAILMLIAVILFFTGYVKNRS